MTQLFESASATVGNNGRAVAVLHPLRAFEKWNVRRMTVSSTSVTLTPTAYIYRNGESPSMLVDGTYTGTLDHTDTSLQLNNGESLIAVWQDGDVGAVCTLTVEGESAR